MKSMILVLVLALSTLTGSTKSPTTPSSSRAIPEAACPKVDKPYIRSLSFEAEGDWKSNPFVVLDVKFQKVEDNLCIYLLLMGPRAGPSRSAVLDQGLFIAKTPVLTLPSTPLDKFDDFMVLKKLHSEGVGGVIRLAKSIGSDNPDWYLEFVHQQGSAKIKKDELPSKKDPLCGYTLLQRREAIFENVLIVAINARMDPMFELIPAQITRDNVAFFPDAKFLVHKRHQEIRDDPKTKDLHLRTLDSKVTAAAKTAFPASLCGLKEAQLDRLPHDMAEQKKRDAQVKKTADEKKKMEQDIASLLKSQTAPSLATAAGCPDLTELLIQNLQWEPNYTFNEQVFSRSGSLASAFHFLGLSFEQLNNGVCMYRLILGSHHVEGRKIPIVVQTLSGSCASSGQGSEIFGFGNILGIGREDIEGKCTRRWSFRTEASWQDQVAKQKLEAR